MPTMTSALYHIHRLVNKSLMPSGLPVAAAATAAVALLLGAGGSFFRDTGVAASFRAGFVVREASRLRIQVYRCVFIIVLVLL